MKFTALCKLLLLMLLVPVIMAGCSAYRGDSFWEESKTKIDLEAKNFKVRKLGAQGNGVSTYLFGIPIGGGGSGVVGIPLSDQNVQIRAMEELHQNWDGKGSCFLHNINVEWTNYGIPGIFLFHQNTVTADIYEFDKEYIDYATRNR